MPHRWKASIKRWLPAASVLAFVVIAEFCIWHGVAGLKRQSRFQLDNMIFQTGVLSPLMYDYIKVLEEHRAAESDEDASMLAQRRTRLQAIRRRIEPHLSVLRQTTDLLSNLEDGDDIRRQVSETLDQTSATLDRVEAELSEPTKAAQVEGLIDSLQDELAFFAGSVVHTIEVDLNLQQERANIFATLIGVLFSALLGVGLMLIRLISVLRAKTRELNRLVATDTLTGLLNRRECMRQAAQMSMVARQRNVPLTMAIIDLDHFKAVNDTYGHPGGDAVLRAVAATLDASRREGDVVARLGGEEFAIVMYDTDQSTGALVCERIRQNLEAAVINFNGRVIPTTASVGMATGRGTDADIELLYPRADKALYQAKAMGRNCMVAANDPDPQEARSGLPTLTATANEVFDPASVLGV